MSVLVEKFVRFDHISLIKGLIEYKRAQIGNLDSKTANRLPPENYILSYNLGRRAGHSSAVFDAANRGIGDYFLFNTREEMEYFLTFTHKEMRNYCFLCNSGIERQLRGVCFSDKTIVADGWQRMQSNTDLRREILLLIEKTEPKPFVIGVG